MFAVIHFPEPDLSSDIDAGRLGRLANKFSPLFEVVDDRTVALDIRGLDLLFPGGAPEIRGKLEDEAAAFGRAFVITGENLAQTILAAICGGGSGSGGGAAPVVGNSETGGAESRGSTVESRRRSGKSGGKNSDPVAAEAGVSAVDLSPQITSDGDNRGSGEFFEGIQGGSLKRSTVKESISAFAAAGKGDRGTSTGNDDFDVEFSALPLVRLGLPRRYAELFGEWGLKTVGDLTSLPAGDLISRLGSEFEPVIRELTGVSPRVLKVCPETREFSRVFNFDDPIDDIETCLAAAAEKLDGLLGEVMRFGLAASAIELTFYDREADDRRIELKLPVPSVNLRFIVKLLQFEAEKIETGAPVRAVAVRVMTAPPRRVQLSLWHPPLPDTERLELTLGKLRRLLGENNVGIPLMRDSFDPTDFGIDPEKRPTSQDNDPDESSSGYLVLRYFELRQPVAFQRSFEEPFYLEIDRRWQRIRRIGGPWFSSGKWWNDEKHWHRREMDVQLVNGQIFRVVDDESGKFFAEGYYD